MTTDAPRTSEWLSTACILCECNCGVEIQLGGEDGRRFVRVRGDKAHPASQGYACEKASRLDYYQNGRDRLTKPLRRNDDGTFEEVDWATAIREVAGRFAAIRDEHGGESIFYYGGGGQGNHLPGGYSRSIRSVLGSQYRSNALAQEKTGEFWVSAKMMGGFTRADFENCEVGVFIGKNPWFSHGIPRARVTLRAIAKDPNRCLIVIDPRRTETADLADIHLQVRPGGDAWLLAAMVGVLVQEDLVKHDWLALHTEGSEAVLPHFAELPVAEYCGKAGVPEEDVRRAARRIAQAESSAFFEALGVLPDRELRQEGCHLLPRQPAASGKQQRRQRYAQEPRHRLANHRRPDGLQRDPGGDPDGPPEALPGDAGGEREPRPLAGRQSAHA